MCLYTIEIRNNFNNIIQKYSGYSLKNKLPLTNDLKKCNKQNHQIQFVFIFLKSFSLLNYNYKHFFLCEPKFPRVKVT